MLEPLNTEWNRKTGILPGKGQICMLGIKYGIVYLTWTDLSGAMLFLQCDEGVFKKHFSSNAQKAGETGSNSTEKLDELLKKKTKFLKYPFEVAK